MENERLPGTFDYGKYLTFQLANFLQEIIEVPPHTWLAIWVMVALFCWCMILAHGDPHTLSWIWLGIGWAMALLHGAFHNYLNRALSMCVGGYVTPQARARTRQCTACSIISTLSRYV